MSNDVTCYKCSASLMFEANSKVSRNEECPKCYANIHSCKMCAFYDKSAYNDCKETMANRIVDKEMANFCDFYKLSGVNNTQNDASKLLDVANSLFKN